MQNYSSDQNFFYQKSKNVIFYIWNFQNHLFMLYIYVKRRKTKLLDIHNNIDDTYYVLHILENLLLIFFLTPICDCLKTELVLMRKMQGKKLHKVKLKFRTQEMCAMALGEEKTQLETFSGEQSVHAFDCFIHL